MEKTLVLMRGVSGSGKSTYANKLIKRVQSLFKLSAVKVSADDFFIKDGVYKFHAGKLQLAHGACKKNAKNAMKDGIDLVVVDNTNTQEWEMKPYIHMAKRYGYRVVFRTVGSFDEESLALYTKRNTHGVPREAIDRMAKRFQSNPKI